MKIENIVASLNLGQQINLRTIEQSLSNVDYNPNKFPGLIFRIKNPKTAILLFRSGKLVCTGTKNIDDIYKAIDKTLLSLESANIYIKEKPKPIIQNIVASSDLKKEINLNLLAINMGMENIEYEPEQFPGLVYRMDDPKVVLLLFGSGKMVCTGAKTTEDVLKAINKISESFKKIGI